MKVGGFWHITACIYWNSSTLHPKMTQTNGGANLIKRLIVAHASNKRREMLETNPNHFLRQMLVEDIYSNLPRERINVLSINIQSHAPHQAKWKIIIPYHRNGQKLEFYTPILSCSSTEHATSPLLFKAFWQSLDDFNSPTNTLRHYVTSKQLI